MSQCHFLVYMPLKPHTTPLLEHFKLQCITALCENDLFTSSHLAAVAEPWVARLALDPISDWPPQVLHQNLIHYPWQLDADLHLIYLVKRSVYFDIWQRIFSIKDISTVHQSVTNHYASV